MHRMMDGMGWMIGLMGLWWIVALTVLVLGAAVLVKYLLFSKRARW